MRFTLVQTDLPLARRFLRRPLRAALRPPDIAQCRADRGPLFVRPACRHARSSSITSRAAASTAYRSHAGARGTHVPAHGNTADCSPALSRPPTPQVIPVLSEWDQRVVG